MTTLAASPTTPSTPTKARAAKAGLVVTALVTLFLGFDTVIHLLNVSAVQEATSKLGQPAYFAFLIGCVEAVCLVLYLVPRTAILGAVLLTGYLGGATAVNLSYQQPVFNVFFAVGTGVVVWAGLWLRDDRVKVLYTR